MSQKKEIAISIENVSKTFNLWGKQNDRLRYALYGLARSFTPGQSKMSAHLEQKQSEGLKLFKALNKISFQIKKGESWGIIGVNGSGKSTLLKLIAGNLPPTEGRIIVDGKVSLLDYTSGLHGEFTGHENIFLKASVSGLSRKKTEEVYDSIIDFAEIGDFIHQPVKTYSSGMLARLGFAIIAHLKPDIIISDEALAVGDAFFVQKCMAFLREFLNDGTFLFVSHSAESITSLCTKAVWLKNGEIAAIGDSKSVTEAYFEYETSKQSNVYLQSEDGKEIEIPSKDNNVVSKHDSDESKSTLVQPELALAMHAAPTRRIRDRRLEFLNRTDWRNDIILDKLKSSESYGVGGAKILDVRLEDEEGAVYSSVIGGDFARLVIFAEASAQLTSPILGFQVKNSLGQVIFADNTFLTTLENTFRVEAGSKWEAIFEFQMPLLPAGEYGVTASLVAGKEDDGAMLHSLKTALILRVVTTGARHGLVGLPMEKIEVKTIS